jgi:hypothetical protein
MLVITLAMVCFMSLNNDTLQEDSIYRVCLRDVNGYITVICFGMNCVDKGDVGCYSCVDDLPSWIQERIALISMVKCDDIIKNVGWRTEKDVFWLTDV